MRPNRTAFMFSLAQKAGAVSSGEVAAESAIRGGTACLVVLSADASKNTRKKFSDMAAYHRVPLVTYLPKAELGRLIGKGERSVAVLTDANLAAQVREGIENEAAAQISEA